MVVTEQHTIFQSDLIKMATFTESRKCVKLHLYNEQTAEQAILVISLGVESREAP